VVPNIHGRDERTRNQVGAVETLNRAAVLFFCHRKDMEFCLVGGDRRFGGVYGGMRDILGYICNLQEMKEESGR
jgi:hypothetical protein